MLDEGGRQFALHRGLLQWVEVVEDRGDTVVINHPQRGEMVTARELYEWDAVSLDEYLDRQVMVESPFDSSAFVVEASPIDLITEDDAPAPMALQDVVPQGASFEHLLSPTERRFMEKGWTLIPFK